MLIFNLHRGRGPISKLIQWQTRSPYSHVSVSLPSGKVIESREFKGVRLLDGLDPSERVDRFKLICTPEQERGIEKFLLSQVGKKYDYVMVARFLSRRGETLGSRETWFCSEMPFAACLANGVKLLERTEPWEVSPSWYPRSYRLELI